MSSLLTTIMFLLFLNAGLAFVIAFFWHARVILTLKCGATNDRTLVPWTALSDQGSELNRYGHFLAGEIYPDLRRKLGRAVAYVVYSFILLFAAGGLIELFAPAWFGRPCQRATTLERLSETTVGFSVIAVTKS